MNSDIKNPFSLEDIEKFRELSNLYITAKSLILYSEEVDPHSRSNIQVYKELRDAFDHIMRVLIARLTSAVIPNKDSKDYFKANIDKAYGHVYRATYDALDGAVMSLKDKVYELSKHYSYEIISKVVPEYAELKVTMEKLSDQIAEHRGKKDVGGNEHQKLLEEYVEDVNAIKEIYRKLLHSQPTFNDLLNEEKKKENSDKFFKILIAVLSAIIIGAFSYIAKLHSSP